VEQYIYKHIKHYDRNCPRVINIPNEMLSLHKDDVVYQTCLSCEVKRAAKIKTANLY
jgi:hypothetical protein